MCVFVNEAQALFLIHHSSSPPRQRNDQVDHGGLRDLCIVSRFNLPLRPAAALASAAR